VGYPLAPLRGSISILLPALFSEAAGAKFSSVQDAVLHDAPMLSFHFRVQDATNHGLWYLRSEDKTFYPGYGGQMWIDRVTLHLRRIDMRATELTGFPAVSHHVNIEYADTALGDGTSFVPPVRASIENCTTPSKCIANDLTFTNCQKFRAESRVVRAR
jgi:hypothetical protein